MDVPAEEVFGLVELDEVADGGAAVVLAFGGAVEQGILGRRVAEEHARLHGREFAEVGGHLLFGVFAGGVEGGGRGVAEAV